MNSKSFLPGIILIALGAFILADNLNLINIYWYDLWDFGYLWPWLLVLGGAFFWVSWLRNREEQGLLVPGTILLVYGLVFWYCTRYGWWLMGEYNLWAFFMIGPGLGFLMMFLLGKHDKGHLVPAGILIGLGVIFLAGWNNLSLLWPLILIAIGLRMIFKYYQKQKETVGSGSGQ